MRGDRLVRGASTERQASGAASLVVDLARTMGMPVSAEEGLARSVMDGTAALDESFLVSDEHGVVPASNAPGPRARRLAEGYARLLDVHPPPQPAPRLGPLPSGAPSRRAGRCARSPSARRSSRPTGSIWVVDYV